ncbi:membrane-associated apoptosis protein-domain-containing protein [Chytriomyces cf. hyalinus JEL632]|nr:membrane-associated apoptosis protein-domain-containing protein [Chytriomyces cf. hyalinus JEL632]
MSASHVDPQNWSDDLTTVCKTARILLWKLRFMNNFILAASCDSVFHATEKSLSSSTTLFNRSESSQPSEMSNASSKSLLRILSNPIYASSLKLLIKRFPHLPDSKQIGCTFSDSSALMLQELEEWYNVFAAVEDFTQVSVVVLKLSVCMMQLDMAVNPSLCRLFLKAFADLCLVVYTVSAVASAKKGVVAGYALAFQLTAGMPVHGYDRIAHFITLCDNPAIMIQNNFLMIAPKISALILSNHKSEFKGPRTWTASELRIVADANTESDHNESHHDLSELSESVSPNVEYLVSLFAIIATPNACAKSGRYNQLYRSCVQYSVTTPLTAERSLNARDELKQSDGQAHSKIRATVAQINSSGGHEAELMRFHAERRTCLAHQLRRLMDAFQMPMIPFVGFQTAMVILYLSKNEIIWYFNSSSKRDPGVVELLWLAKSVQFLLKERKTATQQEIMHCIRHSDVSSTLFLMENYQDINSDASACMTEYVNLVSITNDILCEDGGNEVLPSGVSTSFRDSWLRFQVLAVLPDSDFPETLLTEITPPLDMLYSKMQFLDGFDTAVGEVASFAQLYHVRDRVVSELRECIRERHAVENYYSAFCWIAKDFMELVSVEASDIEKQVTSNAIEGYVNDVYNLIASHAGTLTWVYAEYSLQAAFNTLKSVSVLKQSQQAVLCIVSCICAPCTMIVDQRRYSLSTKFICDFQGRFERFLETAAKVIESCAYQDGKRTIEPERPTRLIRKIQVFYDIAKWMDRQDARLNMLATLQSSLQEHMKLETFPTADVKKAIKTSQSVSTLNAYSFWFSQVFVSHLDSGMLFYSHQRRCFLSGVESSIGWEFYTDPKELVSLCQVLGPAGVVQLDATFQEAQIPLLRCIEAQALFMNAPRCFDTLKKLNGIKRVTTAMVHFAMISKLRSLVAVALNESMQTGSTLASSSALEFIKEFSTESILERLAQIPCKISKFMKANTAFWSLIPITQAAVMVHLANDPPSTYDAHFDGLENNSHVLCVSDQPSLLHHAAAASSVTVEAFETQFFCIAGALVGRLRMKGRGSCDAVLRVLQRGSASKVLLRWDRMEPVAFKSPVPNSYPNPIFS